MASPLCLLIASRSSGHGCSETSCRDVAVPVACTQSNESYIIESAKLTAVAAAPRIQQSGTLAGAGAAPGNRPVAPPSPPAGNLGLLPAGVPQPGGLLEAARPPIGRCPCSADLLQLRDMDCDLCRPLLGPWLSAEACVRGHCGHAQPHLRPAAWAVPVILNVNVPERALTAAFQADCVALVALYLAWTGRRPGLLL